jgi:transcriptional regulator with XRE-family HTH domain
MARALRRCSFGTLVRRRRKALDLTQTALADLVGCAESLIRNIEAEERRPSRQIAERLAVALQVVAEERAAFIQLARREGPNVSSRPLSRPWTPPRRAFDRGRAALRRARPGRSLRHRAAQLRPRA